MSTLQHFTMGGAKHYKDLVVGAKTFDVFSVKREQGVLKTH